MSYRDSTNFRDKTLRCVDCECSFTFTSGEQRFYYSKGLAQPKRCPSCRELRKRTLHPGIDWNFAMARAKEEIERNDNK